MSLFISKQILIWLLEKGIIERINIEDGKKKAFREGCLSLLGNKSQQVKIFSVDVFDSYRGGFVFPLAVVMISTNILLQLT